MIYEKDNVLSEALNYIVTVRYEGQRINEDYLGYWSMMIDNVFNISTASFRSGLNNFYTVLKENKDAKELMGYHFRLMTTLINNNATIMAADELYSTLAHSLRNEVDNDIAFDLVLEDDTLHELTGFEKVILLMHIYQDRIDCALTTIFDANPKGKSKK